MGAQSLRTVLGSRTLAEAYEEIVRPLVLVAEDDAAMRATLVLALEASGFDVVAFPDGASLAQHVEGIPPNGYPWREPVLVVTDVRMPGLSGLDCLTRIREANPALPVVVVTGFGDPELHKRAYALGATAMLDKPFDIDLVIELARQLERQR